MSEINNNDNPEKNDSGSNTGHEVPEPSENDAKKLEPSEGNELNKETDSLKEEEPSPRGKLEPKDGGFDNETDAGNNQESANLNQPAVHQDTGKIEDQEDPKTWDLKQPGTVDGVKNPEDSKTGDVKQSGTVDDVKSQEDPKTGDKPQYPSHQGFAIDENHDNWDPDMTSDEEDEIRNEMDKGEDDWRDAADELIDSYPNPKEELSDEDLKNNDLADEEIANNESLNPDVVTLPPGTILKRYGSDSGKYFSDPGTTEDQLALPDQDTPREEHYYKLQEPLDVHAGTARSYYGKEGGGAQYKPTEGRSASGLLADGVMIEVDADGNPV